jgi:DNA-binding HxlR family transcriptional regulator
VVSLTARVQSFKKAQSGKSGTKRYKLMNITKKINLAYQGSGDVSRIIEDILGCKWTVVVLRCIDAEVTRPSEIVRSVQGLSPKVLNERFRKLIRHNVIHRIVYPEVPPRVEYKLTELGQRLLQVLRELDKIETELQAGDFIE